MTVQRQFIIRTSLTGGILLYPLGYLCYALYRYVYRTIQSTKSRLEEIKTLDKVKQDFIKKREEELAKQDEIRTPDIQTIQDAHTKESARTLQESIIPSTSSSQPESSEELPTPITSTEPTDPVHTHKKNKFIEKILYEAQVLKERGQLDMYEKKIIEGLAIQQQHLELNKMLADLYFHTGQYKKALTLLKKIIERKPDDHKVLRQIGEIYLQRGQFETAQMLIEKALHYKPTNPRYYVSMVEIKYNTNQLDEAISLMEKVIKLRPSNVDYLNAIAKLYEESKDTVNAKKYYYKVLELEPTNEKAKMKMRRL